MNKTVSALLGETTGTGCCGAVDMPMGLAVKVQGATPAKRKKVRRRWQEDTSGDPEEEPGSIIPPDAKEIGTDQPGPPSEDRETDEDEVSMSAAQLDQLATMVADKILARLAKPRAEEAPAPSVGSGTQTDHIASWMIGQKPKPAQEAQLPAIPGAPLTESQAAALMPSAPVAPGVSSAGSGDGLLGQGQKMPDPAPSRGVSFAAYSRFMPK